jgi:hypothetical protein
MIDLTQLSDAHVAALMRVSKSRGRAFFAHPKAQIALRAEYQKRCCKSHNGDVSYGHEQKPRRQS